jgi:hypothetical protein
VEQELARLQEAMHSSIPSDDWEALARAEKEKAILEERLLELYDRLERLEAESYD